MEFEGFTYDHAFMSIQQQRQVLILICSLYSPFQFQPSDRIQSNHLFLSI